MKELVDYLVERDRAMTELDVEWVAKTMPKVPPPIRLLVLHKARYETTSLPDHLRHESRAFLAAGGWDRMTGTPLLPEGELPE